MAERQPGTLGLHAEPFEARALPRHRSSIPGSISASPVPVAVDLAGAFFLGYYGFVCISGGSYRSYLRTAKIDHQLRLSGAQCMQLLSDVRSFPEVLELQSTVKKLLMTSLDPLRFKGTTLCDKNGEPSNYGRNLGNEFFLFYPLGFATDLLIRNPTRAIWGSFDLYVSVGGVDAKGSAEVEFRLENRLHRKSAGHLPPIFGGDYGDSLFDDLPGQDIEVSIEFTETVVWQDLKSPLTPTSY